MSDADLLAPIAADNRRWFPEVFGLRPNCGHCYGQHPPLPEGTLVVCAAFGGGAVGVLSGFVGVSAKVGGHAAVTPEDKKERLFLVPEEDYDKRDEGCFVVDPERHAVWEHQTPRWSNKSRHHPKKASPEPIRAFLFSRGLQNHETDSRTCRLLLAIE
jgi:hypothetical protein